MRLRLAKFHCIEVFEDLLGIRPPPPSHTGNTSNTWRLKPGECPRGYGVKPWGASGVVSMVWDSGRPVVWDVDLPASAESGVGVFCSGILVGDRIGGWRYYEPPGGDPLMLAGIMRGEAMSLVGRAEALFPAVLPEHMAEDWVRVRVRAPWTELVAQLPMVERSWFRSWPIEDPDEAEDNTAAIIAP